MEKVILVNENDIPIGEMEKMEAHLKGVLHRAISVFIFNSKGEWLLQRRAFSKYHSKGLWSNTACSHPAPGETNLEASNRRLKQEMGQSADLHKIFDFIYEAKLDNDLTEHELDHVFVGITDELPHPNSEEVSQFQYISFNELEKQLIDSPEHFTVWFRKIYKRVNQQISIPK